MSTLTSGTRLGPYEILEPAGAGGMGEVYRASDTRLDRIVAIKVLPASFSDNAEMKQRFEREARTVASLKHPNICVLHDIGQQDGVDFLVLEFLQGETLARRLERGPLPLDEALQVAIAIADALDKAHRQGVTHRDLKPGNVMLTESGAKLLDFGLAKWTPPITATNTSNTPTRSAVTVPGMVLGTLQYMAPEQLEGAEADARSDIFAFGALLHEMVTGRKAFEGKSQVLLISAIATSHPPPLSESQPATPPALEHLVRTCLAKDPNDRWQCVRDLLPELQWIAGNGAETGSVALVPAGRRMRERRQRMLLGIAAALILALSLPTLRYLRGSEPPDEFRLRLPVTSRLSPSLGISPDGQSIVYTGGTRFNPASGTNLQLHLLVGKVGSVSYHDLPGTEGARLTFWSPDSRFLAFLQGPQTGRKLRKVDAGGGPPQDICDVEDFQGGAWNNDGTIVFGSSKGLFRVPAEGGKPEPLTTIAEGESGHYWPRFLPDGKRYLYTAWSGESGKRAIFVGSLDSKERTRILAAESQGIYTDPGYLLFQRQDAVYAQVFNPRTLALTGEPVRVADKVDYFPGATDNPFSPGAFDVSRNGVLVYEYRQQPIRINAVDSDLTLAWTDRMGQVLQNVGPASNYRGVSLAPDGERIAVHRHDGEGGDIWVMSPGSAAPVRVTFDPSHDNSMPIWSPDGRSIIYSAHVNGKWGLYQTLADGSGRGTEKLLYESEVPKSPMSWSKDGKWLVFGVRDPKTSGDLWLLPLVDGDKEPKPLIASKNDEIHAQISPDGKWIAYSSNATGRKELYVQPFPSGPGLWQISADNDTGADWPRWRADSKELYYHDRDLGGPMFVVQANAEGAVFKPGLPRELIFIQAINPAHPTNYHFYDVSADGQKFLYFQTSANPPVTANSAEIDPDPASNFTLALHWMSRLK